MDAAYPDSVAASADRAQGQSGTSKCPTFAYRKPKTIEANILQGGRAPGLYPLHRLAPVPDTIDPRLSALDKLGDLHLTIKGVIEQEPEEPHIAPDVLLALCHHIKTRDLSDVEVQGLLTQPNQTGFPCLSQNDTVHILAAYYEAKQAHHGRGETSLVTHRGATFAARVTLRRARRASEDLTRRDLSAMRLRELRDALELAATAEDILLRRPTSKRRRMEEFKAIWRLDAGFIQRRVGMDCDAVCSVDDIRDTLVLCSKYGQCIIPERLLWSEYKADIAAQEAGTAAADEAGVPILRQPEEVVYRTTDWDLLAYSTRSELVWCLPPAPPWWYAFIDSVIPALHDASLDLEQQGRTMRFRLPLPRELPKRAKLCDLVDIFPPVFTVGEAIRRFLSFEYAEGVWWFDDPSHAPADLAAGTLLDTDEDGGGYDSDGSDDCDWTDYH